MLFSKKYSKVILATVFLLFVMFAASHFARAATVDPGLNYAAGTGLSNAEDIRVIIAKIIRIALGFLGIIAVGLIMYAGWLWMTSQGNEEKIEQAKKILKNAIIGLIIILSAFGIVSFVINQLNGGGVGPGGGPGNKPPSYYGLSALGNGIIESHYPARDQKEVPRNTSIIITFRELMSANTLCKPKDTAPAVCDGDDINTDVVRIFKQSEEAICVVGNSPASGCTSLVKEIKVYSTTDGKTYVFALKNYLGSPSEYINYTVYLGEGLLRKTGDKAFPGLQKDYGWSFEVSNKIDLTPPQVKRNGVIPAPDNSQDTVTPGASQPASGTITVNSRPSVYQDAKVQNIATGTPKTVIASAEVDKDCPRDGNFSIAIAGGPIASLYTVDTQNKTINLGQGIFGSKGNNKQVIFSECNLALTLSAATDNFAVGYLWNLTLSKVTAADIITAGNTTYIASNVESGANFKVSLTGVETAKSIADVINSSNSKDVSATASGNVVTVKAKIAGLDGNSIDLSSSNKATLEVSAMNNGKDKKDDVKNNCIKNPPQPNCKTDEPMNSAIQIEFNEAIMPLVVSGASDDLKDYIRVVNDGGIKRDTEACTENYECLSYKCEGSTGNKKCVGNDGPKPSGQTCQSDGECLSYKCDSTNSKCVGNSLAGKFAVSNQYSTVDFLSDKECGFNACGEKIYCLPANSHLRVELNAASLIPCADKDNKADNSLCQDKSPFNTCDPVRKFCWDGTKYFPQANEAGAKIVDGLVDAAFNSLDGNRDDSAYGPASFYNENTPENTEAEKLAKAASGDSYQWSFYISNKLDLTPPEIKDPTIPAKDKLDVDLNNAITISFDKLMLSSRLTTGSIKIQNGKEKEPVTHYLLNLRSFLDQPLGYWVTNEGKQSSDGGIIDSTDVYINHSPFSNASSYKAQAGSGLKDIYQNCFKPCAGPACTTGNNGVNDQKPCCCNGAPGTSCP